MGGRRSQRQPMPSAPLALLDNLVSAHRALTQVKARVDVDGPVYRMLEAATGVLDGVAVVLGRSGRFIRPGHSTLGPRAER